MKKLPWILLGMVLMAIPSALAYTTFFTDIDSDAWYYDSVMALRSRGIIEGYEDQTYRPDNNVNRAELAVMLDRLITAVEDGCVYNNTFVMEGGYVQSVTDETTYLGCENGETFEAYVVD